jgi:FkbM family methyltransferase
MKIIIKNVFKKCGFDIRRYGTSEEALVKHFIDFINPDLMIDVGANVGQSRDFIRSIGYKGKIISFEPLASAHKCLMERSKTDELWEIAPRMAIADVMGECILNVSQNCVSSSVLNILPQHLVTAPESIFVATETVPCATLDSVWGKIIDKDFESIFLKIDVQGYEDRVINGVADNIKRVKGLKIELSVVPLYKEQILMNEMLRIIDGLGFELFALLPGFAEKKTGRILQFDGLFFQRIYFDNHK